MDKTYAISSINNAIMNNGGRFIFKYDGYWRYVRILRYDDINLYSYQFDGGSVSGGIPNYRTFNLEKIQLII